MQTCYNCGKEVDDNVLICPDCGALVKRYGKPVREEQEAFFQDGGDPDTASSRPAGHDAVRLDAQGKPHFRGLVCFWLILCALFAGYMVVGFSCVLLVYQEQAFFLETLGAYPEFSDMMEFLTLMLQSVGTYYVLYVLLLVLFALKLVWLVWFLISHRRLAFYLTGGVCAALCLFNLVMGSGLSSFLCALDVALTYLMLRRFWKRLRP